MIALETGRSGKAKIGVSPREERRWGVIQGRLHTVPADEVSRWQKASESVAVEWVKEVSAKGYDGQKLLDEARALLAN